MEFSHGFILPVMNGVFPIISIELLKVWLPILLCFIFIHNNGVNMQCLNTVLFNFPSV